MGEEKSPNANTVSLFHNGQRMSQPQAIPEALRGKALFPTIAFKNMLVYTNFGPSPLAPLPFTCRMIGDSSSKDVSVTKEIVPKDGKYEAVFPVGIPDEGIFMWLDMFHQKNPGYAEISERSILDWAEKSGLNRSGGYKSRSSNDQPELALGIQKIDDGSLSHMIKSIAPVQTRHYIVMQLRSNLIKDERTALIKKFNGGLFKKIAHVQVGEPTLEFK